MALLLLAGQESEPPPPLPEEPAWEFAASFFYSGPPEDHGYGTGILYADRGALHLEARYGYEDRDTASLWGGWTLAHEAETWSLAATPMLGAVLGQTEGVAPGLEVDASWWRLGWYAEAEYLIDVEESDDNFFYMWSTLTVGVTDWLRAGLVTERTQLVDTDLDVQRGLALEFTVDVVQLALYTYNLGEDDDQYSVLSAQVSF
jgi:hypothetical protein